MGKLLEHILLIGLGLIVLSSIISVAYPFFNNIKILFIRIYLVPHK